MNASTPSDPINPYEASSKLSASSPDSPLTPQEINTEHAKFYFWCLQLLPILFAFLTVLRPFVPYEGLGVIMSRIPWESIFAELISGQLLLLALSLTIRNPTQAVASNMLLRLLLVAYLVGIQRGVQQVQLETRTVPINYGDLATFVEHFGWSMSSIPVTFVLYLLGGWVARHLGVRLQTSISLRPLAILPLLLMVSMLLIFGYHFVENLVPLLSTVLLHEPFSWPTTILFVLCLCGIGCRLNYRIPLTQWAIPLAFAIITSLVLSLPFLWYYKLIPLNADERLVAVVQHSIVPLFLGASWYFLSQQGFHLQPETFPFASTVTTEPLPASSIDTSEAE